jgi:hypothetical protein
MRLPKPTRTKLYKAKGKPIWISWPSSAPEPKAGKTYRVSLKQQSFAILVEQTKERGTKALVKIEDDPRRFLHGLNGIRNAAGDYESEPERVSHEYEALLAAEGHQKTVLQSAEQRMRSSQRRKELRAPEQRSLRATRTVERHQRAIERRLAA